ILKKSHRVLKEVTGGQDTVGLRVPDHKLALTLLREFGGGIAAPSANRFGRVSPTRAEHVQQDLGSDVDFILDGGPSEVGVESTIVDFSPAEPVILRPGGVTREQLEETLRQKLSILGAGGVRAPGQMESHYAPRAAVELVDPAGIQAPAQVLRSEGEGGGVLDSGDLAPRRLYASLRRGGRGGRGGHRGAGAGRDGHRPGGGGPAEEGGGAAELITACSACRGSCGNSARATCSRSRSGLPRGSSAPEGSTRDGRGGRRGF